MTQQCSLEVLRTKEYEKRDDADVNDKGQKFLDDRIYLLKKVANNNPGFKLSLHDRIFFWEHGYTARVVGKSQSYDKTVRMVPYNPSGSQNITENRHDLKFNFQNSKNPNYKEYSRPDWKHFGGQGDVSPHIL